VETVSPRLHIFGCLASLDVGYLWRILVDKLTRLSGSTFSTSGKRWLPFRSNPRLARRAARLRRLKKDGLTGGESKAEMRALAEKLAPRGRPLDITAV
jgi:hypothetical protein